MPSSPLRLAAAPLIEYGAGASCAGRWRYTEHGFWTTPAPFCWMEAMAPELHQGLAGSTCIITKGDLNYRWGPRTAAGRHCFVGAKCPGLRADHGCHLVCRQAVAVPGSADGLLQMLIGQRPLAWGQEGQCVGSGPFGCSFSSSKPPSGGVHVSE